MTVFRKYPSNSLLFIVMACIAGLMSNYIDYVYCGFVRPIQGTAIVGQERTKFND